VSIHRLLELRLPVRFQERVSGKFDSNKGKSYWDGSVSCLPFGHADVAEVADVAQDAPPGLVGLGSASHGGLLLSRSGDTTT
jgi:hypothetical protein